MDKYIFQFYKGVNAFAFISGCREVNVAVERSPHFHFAARVCDMYYTVWALADDDEQGHIIREIARRNGGYNMHHTHPKPLHLDGVKNDRGRG